MGMPSSANARLFYRVARQRREDVELLLKHDRRAAAVYLAGYCVECAPKALILSSVPASEELALLDSFRGARAHDYVWLRRPYQERSGLGMPREVIRHFLRVSDWSPDLRYKPGTLPLRDSMAFVDSVWSILEWAEGRL